MRGRRSFAPAIAWRFPKMRRTATISSTRAIRSPLASKSGRAAASAIEARAHAIALEQSIESPIEAVNDARVLDEVLARVVEIVPTDGGEFDATIRLAAETTGFEAGQLLNMLFGNTSLQDDVKLVDVKFPPAFTARFGGPRFGIPGIREVTGVHGRPLTCSALKPQGLAPAQLAALAH